MSFQIFLLKIVDLLHRHVFRARSVVLRLKDGLLLLAKVTTVVTVLLINQVLIILVVDKFVAVVNGVQLWLAWHPHFVRYLILIVVKLNILFTRVEVIC